MLSGKQNEKTLLEAVLLTCIIWKSFVKAADFSILWSILNPVAVLWEKKLNPKYFKLIHLGARKITLKKGLTLWKTFDMVSKPLRMSSRAGNAATGDLSRRKRKLQSKCTLKYNTYGSSKVRPFKLTAIKYLHTGRKRRFIACEINRILMPSQGVF